VTWPTRCVRESDNRRMVGFIQLFDGDFDVVDQRHFPLFQMQNDTVFVNILLQVSDDNTVQHWCWTCLQNCPVYKPLLAYQTRYLFSI